MVGAYHGPMPDCWPWFHAKYSEIAATSWAKNTVPSGCVADSTGNVPCSPETMRAKAEDWLARNATAILGLIGGKLDLTTYTLARYLHSEVGTGTIEERVAVGEAAVNQATKRAGMLGDWVKKLNQMLLPNGMYGAIHAPDAYCASLGMKPMCNPAKRWAATTRDPTILSILAAHLVASGSSGGIAQGAETQWGPDAFKFSSDGSKINSADQVRRFVNSVAKSNDQRYYWVGPIPGVDPWHTFLVKKGPSPSSPLGLAMIEAGVRALPIDGSRPIRPDWSGLSTDCSKPLLANLPRGGQTFLMVALGLAAGTMAATVASRYATRASNDG